MAEAGHPAEIGPDLLTLAESALTGMVNPSGLCCHEIVEGGTPRGESVRYTLIVLLGLLSASKAGRRAKLSVEKLTAAVDTRLERVEVTPGDIGLRLWVESRAPAGATGALLEYLPVRTEVDAVLARLEGMELAWLVIGLALTAEEDPGTSGLLRAALEQLLGPNLAESGLLFHFGAPGLRRRFPNFATQIYSLLAFATVARLGLDGRAEQAGRQLADALLGLQRPDGGWPWLFDAKRGIVVEHYEVYSVHQHGMAPMALRAIADHTGDERYAEAAAAGVGWLFGANELGRNMVPLERGLTYRSIRRRRPFSRLALYANTVSARAFGRPLLAHGGALLEVNETCRPYELGWLLEAGLHR